MRSSTLSDQDLKKFCDKTGLKFNICTLEQLNTSTVPKNCFVFTGNNSDSFNNGYHNHWLFLFGNKLFDSYSYQSKYTLPSFIESVVTHPKILQEFDTNVCGEYCCAFYWFTNNSKHFKGGDYKNIGFLFCETFELTNNRRENDTKINKWFDQITK